MSEFKTSNWIDWNSEKGIKILIETAINLARSNNELLEACQSVKSYWMACNQSRISVGAGEDNAEHLGIHSSADTPDLQHLCNLAGKKIDTAITNAERGYYE